MTLNNVIHPLFMTKTNIDNSVVPNIINNGIEKLIQTITILSRKPYLQIIQNIKNAFRVKTKNLNFECSYSIWSRNSDNCNFKNNPILCTQKN